jgi:hypothetical protein
VSDFGYYLVDTSSETITLTIPDSSTSVSGTYVSFHLDAGSNPLVVETESGESIEGDTSQEVKTPGQSISLINDGTAWHIVQDNRNLTYDADSDGIIDLSAGGTGVDLSTSGGANHFLAQDGSHIISARSIDTADLPTVPVGKGGTNVTSLTGDRVLKSANDGLSVEPLTGDGILKLASGVPSVAALARADMPTGSLFVDAAIGSTLQAIEDAAGNASGLRVSTGDIEVNGLTIGRGAGGDIRNSVVGYNALYNNTTGNSQAAIGYGALSSNTTGQRNTAVGYNALYNNTTGNQNTALGYAPLFDNTTGQRNTAVGYGALSSNTTGNQNTALGYAPLFDNTTGYRNIAVGQEAGRYAGSGTTPNETSSKCIYLGSFTRAGADGRVREIVIGEGVIGSGDDTATIGGTIVFPDMPTSATGLPSGALWCDTTDSNRIKMVI